MTDISTFPTIRNVLYAGSNIGNFKTGAAIDAGQVVELVDTGVDLTVHPLDGSAGDSVVGVALYDASSGGVVAVALAGSIAYVANADDGTAIDAGHWVECDDNAVKGTVHESAITASGGATATLDLYVVGKLLTDMAASGTAICYIMPQTITRANSS